MSKVLRRKPKNPSPESAGDEAVEQTVAMNPAAGAQPEQPADAAAGPAESEVTGAINELSRAIAGLRLLIGEDQLDVRARVTRLEERIGVLEQMVGEIVAGRRKKAQRLAGGREPSEGDESAPDASEGTASGKSEGEDSADPEQPTELHRART